MEALVKHQSQPAMRRNQAAPSLATTELRDTHAEAVCIACAMSRSDYALEVVAIPTEFFICGENQTIVMAMRELWNRGQGINFTTVKDELIRLSLFDQIGGMTGLADFRQVIIQADGSIKASESDSIIFATLKDALDIVLRFGVARMITDQLGEIRIELIAKSTRPDEALTRLRALINASEVRTVSYARSDSEDNQIYHARLDALGKGQIKGMPTGFKGYDETVGGLFGGESVLITGPKKNAKSALSLDVGNFAVKGGIPTAIFTTEMRVDQVRDRRTVMNAEGLLELDHFKGGVKIVTPKDLKVMHEVWEVISHHPMYIVEKVSDIDIILLETERLIVQRGVRLFIFDFLQRFKRKGVFDREVLEYSSGKIKDLLNEYAGWGVAGICLNQLNSTGNLLAKQEGIVSSDHSHMGSSPTKDADVISNVWLEPQEFYCKCKKQTKMKEYFVGKKKTEREVPLWETYPAGGWCTVCESYIQRNHVRRGRWSIEDGRSTMQGTDIWFEFNGSQMNFKELQHSEG